MMLKNGSVGDDQNGATLRYFCASCGKECITKKHKYSILYPSPYPISTYRLAAIYSRLVARKLH